MSAISGISSSNWSSTQSVQYQRHSHGDGQKLAENLFSKLDTTGQGYLQKSDLQSALDKVSPSTSSTKRVDDLFAKMDTNNDKQVSKEEFTNTLKEIASQVRANADMQAARKNDRPPPPPPPQNGSGQDAGFTKDELSSQLKNVGSSDSRRSDLVNKIVNNFDKADTDGNGKVSLQEARTYDQSSTSNSASASSGNSNSTNADDTNAKILNQVMHQMQTYSPANHSNSENGVSIFA